MPVNLLDPRHGPTVAPTEFFARRHERDPALRAAYEEIAQHRRLEIDRRGYEPDAPDDAREAAARRIASGAYRAYLSHDPETGDAVDLGEGATLVVGRSISADGGTPPSKWQWGFIAGLVSVGLLQFLAARLARRPEETRGNGG